MEPIFTFAGILKDIEYVKHLQERLSNPDDIPTYEGLKEIPLENLLNKCYVVRVEKISRIFTFADGREAEFSAQKAIPISSKNGFLKRTAQEKVLGIRVWEFWQIAQPKFLLLHFTSYKPRKKSRPVTNNNLPITDSQFASEMAEDEILREVFGADSHVTGEHFDNSMNFTVPDVFSLPGSIINYDFATQTLNFSCNVNVREPYQYSNQAGADYAEWIPRHDPSEIMQPGDVVGVISGNQGITKTILPSYVVSVISTRHALCANLPPPDVRPRGEPVAFKGQAPVKIIGKVKLNDIIVPSGKNDGTGIARRFCRDPEMKSHVIGQAWEESSDEGVKLVNCMIDIQSPGESFKTESADEARKYSELQELIMVNLVNKDNECSFLDVHLTDPTAVFTELKNVLQSLLEDLSGLTVILWVDKSALPGFIKNQFLRDFGVTDALSGGVAIPDKESLVLVEEWNRDVSFPDYEPIDFDLKIKQVNVVRSGTETSRFPITSQLTSISKSNK